MIAICMTLLGWHLQLCAAVNPPGFVAFNDSVPGLGTSSKATSYGPGDHGVLKDFTTGVKLGVQVSIQLKGGVAGAVQGIPDFGTPASVIFDGIVDFAGFPDPGIELIGSTNSLVITFSGLDPDLEYNFEGTAIRGNINYGKDRWSVFEIQGAQSFVAHPTDGAVVHSDVSTITGSQIVIATGDNVSGDLAWWEHIRPGTNGTFSILSQQYTGTLPSGKKASGNRGYGITGFRLEQAGEYAGRTEAPSKILGQSRGGITGVSNVWVIVMENHDWSSIKGSSYCPYINGTLLPQAVSFEKYYNPPSIHPSLPNYLWLISGTNFGIRDDAASSVNHRASTNTLFHQLDAAGISWKCYAEDISGKTCPTNTSGNYAERHVPFLYFDKVRLNLNYCTNHVRPYSEMAGDLNAGTVAHFNFLVPNLTNDMHNLSSGSPSTRIQGDNWLKREIPKIMNSAAYTNGGLIVVTFDEGEGSTGDGPIGTLLLSPRLSKPGKAFTDYRDHSSLLRTIQDIFGLTPYLGGALYAHDLGDAFQGLKLISIGPDAANHWSIQVDQCVPGHHYELQSANDLTGTGWRVISDAVASDTTLILAIDDPASVAQFFRIVETP